MRDKSQWSKEAVLADIIQRLGFALAKKNLWSQYVMLVESVGSSCELADKAAVLLFKDEEISNILKELSNFYGK